MSSDEAKPKTAGTKSGSSGSAAGDASSAFAVSSEAIDRAITTFEAGDIVEAHELLAQDAFEAEEREGEQRLSEIIEVVDQMVEHLEGAAQRDFERLSDSASRRLNRIRDARLPPRLAQAFKEWEDDDLERAIDLIQDELFAAQREGNREAVEEVMRAAEELRDALTEDEDPGELDRLLAGGQ